MTSVGWEGRVKAEQHEEAPLVERFMQAANEALALTEANLPELARVYRDVVAEAGIEAAARFAEIAGGTTAAAWDESRVKRYPRGTPVSGPAGGGRFAPRGAAGSGSRRDETNVEKKVRAYVETLADYFKDRPDYAYTPERVEQEIERLLAAYREEYEPGFRAIEERLSGFPGVTITPQLDEDKLVSLAEGNTGIAGFRVSLDAGDVELLDPDVSVWYWHRLPGEEYPDEAIMLPSGDALTVEEPLDITDPDYFPAGRPDLSGRYADALDAVRGVKREGFVTLHRGMSTAEAEAWEAGEEIPVGKFFTSSRTADMAQDVSGEFPELYSWKVARADVVETEPGVFQLRRNARLREDGTITAAGPPAWEPPPLDSLIDVTKIKTELDKRSRKTRAKAAEDAVRPIMTAMGLSFSLQAPLVQDLISTAGRRAGALAIPGLEDAVRYAIQQAFEQGLGVPETAALIAEKTEGLAGYQSEMLARTDLIGMANGGSLIGAKAVWPEGGVVKRWVNATDSRTVNDGRIRPTHLAANGLVAELDGTFPVGDAELLYPGDPAGPDGEVINCRCTVVYEEAPVTAGADWWWSDDLTSAAWDESRVTRYPKGTPISGPAGGGRFAPKEAPPDQDAHAREAREAHAREIQSISWDQSEGAKQAAQRDGFDTVEGWAAALEERLPEELANTVLRIRTPVELVDEITHDGRFKTQYETQTSQGTLDNGIRAVAESRLFGLPELPETRAGADEWLRNRPVYGYLEKLGAGRDQAEQYGPVKWELRHEVRDRTTWTGGDSLGQTYVPSPVNDPSYLSLGSPSRVSDETQARVVAGEESPLHGTTHLNDPLGGALYGGYPGYIEAQIHGGVTLDDVAAVILPSSLRDVIDGPERPWGPGTYSGPFAGISPEMRKLRENELKAAVARLRERGITVEYE